MEAWAAEMVSQAKQIGTMESPAVTWNLLVTSFVGVVISMMLWSLKRKIVQADDLKDRMLNQSLKALEQKIEDWQIGAKERTKALCDKIDALKTDVKERVHIEACHERHEAVKNDIKKIEDKVFYA